MFKSRAASLADGYLLLTGKGMLEKKERNFRCCGKRSNPKNNKQQKNSFLEEKSNEKDWDKDQ